MTAYEATFDTSLGTPPLADAIDRQPLIVAPNTGLVNVGKLMHKTAQGTCEKIKYQLSWNNGYIPFG